MGTYLAQVRSIMLSIVVIFATALVVVTIVHEVAVGTYAIDTIETPSEISSSVATGEGVAGLIRDEIGRIATATRANVVIRPVTPDLKEPVVAVTGTSLPLRYVATLVRDTLGVGYFRISGEIVNAGKLPISPASAASVVSASPDSTLSFSGICSRFPNSKCLLASGAVTEGPLVRLVLRRSDKEGGPFFDGVGEINAVIEGAALAAMEFIEPLTAAAFIGLRNDRAQKHRAIALATSALASVQNGAMRGGDDFAFRAHLTIAQLYSALEEYDKAAKEFNSADEEFGRLHAGKRSHAVLDGLGYIAFQRGKRALEAGQSPTSVFGDYFGPAESLYREARSADATNPDYDSALYHLAEVYDERSRFVLERLLPSTCASLSDLVKASQLYDELLRKHPDFAFAYERHGTLLIQQYYYFRNKGTTGCDSYPEVEVSQVSAIYVKALETLDGGLIRDPSLGGAWLQSGILQHQHQDPQLLLGDPAVVNDLNRRRKLLDNSVERLSRATALMPENYESHRRLGEALRSRSCITGEPEKVKFATAAVKSYCRAVSTIQTAHGYELREADQWIVNNIMGTIHCMVEDAVSCTTEIQSVRIRQAMSCSCPR